jgi:hypothetical protein
MKNKDYISSDQIIRNKYVEDSYGCPVQLKVYLLDAIKVWCNPEFSLVMPPLKTKISLSVFVTFQFS